MRKSYDLSKAIQINSNNDEAFLFRAYSCEGLGKQKSALYDYDQVIRLKPNEGLPYFKRGLLEQEMSDKKSACKDFKKAAELGYPDASDYTAGCK